MGDVIMGQDANQAPKTDWAELMHVIGPALAERADLCDANDTFVTENFAELKERGVLAAGVPTELGGGGASYPALCKMLRVLGQYCGSTALTLSMHTHPLATNVWRWRRDPAPFERLLRRVADERRCYCRCAEAKEQMSASEERQNKKGELHHANWSSSAVASFRSEVSNPSVNQQ